MLGRDYILLMLYYQLELCSRMNKGKVRVGKGGQLKLGLKHKRRTKPQN